MVEGQLSVVVPAFNEEKYIGACLESLLAQEADILEIIVVDNNSTDTTCQIVEKFSERSPKVRLIVEPASGVVHARNRGFDSAQGSIRGRVDADSRVEAGWARAVIDYFDRDDATQVGGVTGLNNSYDSPYRRLKKAVVDWQVRRGMLGNERRIPNLHGANMAIRAGAWDDVREDVCSDTAVHEDFDLAICLVRKSYEIAQLDHMWVEISPRRAYTSPWSFTEYTRATLLTGQKHGLVTPRYRVAVALHWLGHLAAWLAYRPYDPHKNRFSVKRALLGGGERVMPVKMRGSQELAPEAEREESLQSAA